MADAVSTTTGADVTGGVGETAGNAAAAAAGEKTVAELQAEVEAQTKRANEGYKTLRKRDEEQRQLRERIDKNERDMADLRASIKGGGKPAPMELAGDEPERTRVMRQPGERAREISRSVRFWNFLRSGSLRRASQPESGRGVRPT